MVNNIGSLRSNLKKLVLRVWWWYPNITKQIKALGWRALVLSFVSQYLDTTIKPSHSFFIYFLKYRVKKLPNNSATLSRHFYFKSLASLLLSFCFCSTAYPLLAIQTGNITFYRITVVFNFKNPRLREWVNRKGNQADRNYFWKGMA